MKVQPVYQHGGMFITECERDRWAFESGVNGAIKTPVDHSEVLEHAPHQPDDEIYVKETFQLLDDSPLGNDLAGVPEGRFMGPSASYKGVCGDRSITWRPVYRADGELVHPEYGAIRWRPSVHMTQDLARTFLRIKSVKAMQVRSISREECVAEGIDKVACPHGYDYCLDCGVGPKIDWRIRWNLRYAKKGIGWDTNCWMWSWEVEKIECQTSVK